MPDSRERMQGHAGRRTGRLPGRLRAFLILGLAAIGGGVAARVLPWWHERQLAAMSPPALAERARRDPADAAVQFHHGAALLRAGSPAEAARAFQRAVEADPAAIRAYTGLARSLAALGRHHAAEQMFRHAIELAPRDVEAHFFLARLYFDRGEYLKAVPELEAAARLRPRDANIWYTLGQVYARAFKRDGSLDALQRAVKLDPGQADYWRDLGRALWDYSRLDEAETAFLRAAALRPQDPIILIWLAQIYLQKPDTPENRRAAEETLRKCARIAPDLGEVHVKLGELLHRTGRYAEAERELRLAVRLSPSSEQALFQLGQVLVRLGRRAEGERYLKGFEELTELLQAVESLRDQITHAPRKPEPRLRLARLYRRYGHLDGAVQEYRQYAALRPGDAAAARELADCLRRAAAGAGEAPAGKDKAP